MELIRVSWGRGGDLTNLCARSFTLCLCRPARAADQIEYWIRRYVFHYCDRTHPSERKLSPTRNRNVGFFAIGQIGRCLKDQYHALATPIPPHLAALVKQLKAQEWRWPARHGAAYAIPLAAFFRSAEARLWSAGALEVEGFPLPLRPLAGLAQNEELA
jgi:hypothetical protein